MRPSNDVILTANISSASTTYNSSTIFGWGIVRLSYQAVVGSASISGTFKLQASNDQPFGAQPSQFIPTNWNDVSSSSITASSTATARSFMSPSLEVCNGYFRVVYTDATSGTLSTIQITMHQFSF